MHSNLRTAYILSWIVAALMTLVSAGGAIAPEWLYRDNDLVTYAFRGQDIVTLVVSVPLLVVALLLERRGSARGRLLWMAMLLYAFYGYLFYAFGAAFNVFFLAYVAVMACSLYALVFSVPRIDASALVAAFGAGESRARGVRAVALFYLLFTAVGLGLLWTGMSVGFIVTGDVPAAITAFGHPTGVVFALDLAIAVPLMVVGAVQLWKRRAWGWVLATVLSLKGVVYTLGLSVSTLSVAAAGAGTSAELPIWGVLTVLGAASAVLLMREASTSGVLASSSAIRR